MSEALNVENDIKVEGTTVFISDNNINISIQPSQPQTSDGYTSPEFVSKETKAIIITLNDRIDNSKNSDKPEVVLMLSAFEDVSPNSTITIRGKVWGVMSIEEVYEKDELVCFIVSLG